MPTRLVSNYGLNKWYNTIQKWKATEDIHLGLHPNIEYLENKISFPVKRYLDEHNAITQKYFFIDDKGQVKYEKVEGNEQEQPCLLPDKKMEDFEKEINELNFTMVELKL